MQSSNRNLQLIGDLAEPCTPFNSALQSFNECGPERTIGAVISILIEQRRDILLLFECFDVGRGRWLSRINIVPSDRGKRIW
jgi:hypothetical protein